MHVIHWHASPIFTRLPIGCTHSVQTLPCRFGDVYTIKKKLGQGAFATVYKVEHKITKGVFAMKEINLRRIKSAHTKDMLMREIKLMKLLDHPNIIKIMEVFRESNILYLVMECCEGGELFDDLYDQPTAKYTEANAKLLIKKMMGALAYMHANGMVHRDLKLENFIFTDRSAARCAFFGRNLHSRMPLDPTHVRLKRTCV
jgi:calcium-dependent protein kinase